MNICEESFNNDDINSDSSTLPADVVTKLIEQNQIDYKSNNGRTIIQQHVKRFYHTIKKFNEQLLNIVIQTNRIVQIIQLRTLKITILI